MRRIVVGVAGVATLLVPISVAGAGSENVRPTSGLFAADLSGGDTFAVVLVIGKDNAKKIEVVDLACAPDGIYDLQNYFTIDTDVKVRKGKFTVKHDQVVVKGEFTEPNVARGTVKPRGSFAGDAEACGIPARGRWTSQCSLGVVETPQPEDAGPGEVDIVSSIGTGANGTTIASYTGGGFETVEPTAECTA